MFTQDWSLINNCPRVFPRPNKWKWTCSNWKQLKALAKEQKGKGYYNLRKHESQKHAIKQETVIKLESKTKLQGFTEWLLRKSSPPVIKQEAVIKQESRPRTKYQAITECLWSKSSPKIIVENLKAYVLPNISVDNEPWAVKGLFMILNLFVIW